MNNKIKGLAVILWNFFIVFSIVCFLISLMGMIKENITDYWLVMFSACGCCFLIVMITWYRFGSMIKNKV